MIGVVNLTGANYNLFMRLVLQRVKKASVAVGQEITGAIDRGLLIFLGVAKNDTIADADALVQKVVELRVFDDTQGKMNLSAADVKAAFLVVSQFTLLGNCHKGRRPSFDDAADPLTAEKLYDHFVQELKKHPFPVATGRFRAMMEVSLINDGPVTLMIDSQCI